MCGIFGYVGPQDAAPIVLDGLGRLAYRGYDSAGAAVIDDQGRLGVRKTAGKLENLLRLVERDPISGRRGVGHTRWATHGAPSEANAHPHVDGAGEVVVVHNGIVENYAALREELAAGGHEFTSDTDTEVIPHLVQELLALGASLEEAVRVAASRLRGAHAIACMHTRTPDTIVAARVGNAGGVLIGAGAGETYIASDLPALAPLAPEASFLEAGEVVVARPGEWELMTLDGKPAPRARRVIAAGPAAAAKGGHKHFMLKETLEQPEAAMSVLRGRLAFAPQRVELDELPFSSEESGQFSRAVFLGMGTSVYAAQVGARYMETLARMPTWAENAAEFRRPDVMVDERTLVVAVTQSGETADTLEAMEEARRRGARVLAITNVEGSQATRAAEAAVLTRAGPEIGVASTKTMTAAMTAMLLLACALGRQRETLSANDAARRVDELARLPALLGDAIALARDDARKIAPRYVRSRRLLFIGRGLLEPIAREGALKLKEISYVHAEGMSAAEIKHGPIALVDVETPVVALALDNALYEKTLANISQVRARRGGVIAIANEGDEEIAALADAVIRAPECPELLQPIVATPAVQLLAYEMADYLGNDVDQPRNLAKSVTVE